MGEKGQGIRLLGSVGKSMLCSVSCLTHVYPAAIMNSSPFFHFPFSWMLVKALCILLLPRCVCRYRAATSTPTASATGTATTAIATTAATDTSTAATVHHYINAAYHSQWQCYHHDYYHDYHCRGPSNEVVVSSRSLE